MEQKDEPFVISTLGTQWEEALEVTVAGVGTTFAILIVLMLLILAMKWAFATRFVQRKTGTLAAAKESAAQRDRALAAAIAVSAALAEDEASSRQDSSPGTTSQ